jgi:hypothetical protein
MEGCLRKIFWLGHVLAGDEENFGSMEKDELFELAEFAMKKLHPKWTLFIDDLMRKIKPAWLGEQSKDKAHFIHLIGFSKKEKAQVIIMDLLELLGWHKNAALLFTSSERNSADLHEIAETFFKANPILPKVVFTDMLHTILIRRNDLGDCILAKGVTAFMRNPESLLLNEIGFSPIKPDGSIVISYLDVFMGEKFIQKRFMLHHFLEKKEVEGNEFRSTYDEWEIKEWVELDLIRRDELLFFAKDQSKKINNVKRLVDLKEILEIDFTKKKGFPIVISDSAMDYYLAYVFTKNLPFYRLKLDMAIFFRLVVQKMPSVKCMSTIPKSIEIQFKNGWKYQIN